ncbi:hypothetical protein LPU83_pLPU83d_1058 (plasmid) [Rhizobium favelukesii]|uniref:Uncharacterized protein n=1 Tax=Rhizobium favelukesii TaxID=348824 RepID=W6RUV6_9HYPH|nr:hypothetical protein LPU83_pLPU83d_1058 [Rhizobium favelukesii]
MSDTKIRQLIFSLSVAQEIAKREGPQAGCSSCSSSRLKEARDVAGSPIRAGTGLRQPERMKPPFKEGDRKGSLRRAKLATWSHGAEASLLVPLARDRTTIAYAYLQASLDGPKSQK